MPETSMPTIETIQEVTWKNLKGKLEDKVIKEFLDSLAGALRIPAEGSLEFVGIVGKVKCRPTEEPYSQWEFEARVWGAGAADVTGVAGILSTNDWDALVRQTTGCHAQTTAIEFGGWLQITFLRELYPIGQYNGVVKGAGLVECGGDGKWRRK